MAQGRVTLTMNTAAVTELFDELKVELERLAQFPDLFIELRRFLADSGDLFVVERDLDAAAGAREPTVIIKPSDRFRDFVAALRARIRDFE